MPCKSGKQACKPNFVSARWADGNHSSRLFVTEKLERPTRKRRLASRQTLSGQLKNRFPIWSCTTRSLPSRACYHTRWCALTAPFHTSLLRAVLFSVALVVVRDYRTPGCYPARCPLVFGLSSYKFLQAIARLASLFRKASIS